jgi:SAM-dependent methyltransferase
MSGTLNYHPGIFDADGIAQAKAIILTTEEGVDSDTRWMQETPYLAELIGAEIAPRPGQLVIDYGCGIGRLAKEMIARFNCAVLGVDISPRMRALAMAYVDSDKFTVCPPAALDHLLAAGLRADAAISVWVLQHCYAPKRDIALLAAAVKPGGRLLVVNNHNRAVPTEQSGWVHDGIDMKELLAAQFTLLQLGALDPLRVTQTVTDFSFYGTYKR